MTRERMFLEDFVELLGKHDCTFTLNQHRLCMEVESNHMAIDLPNYTTPNKIYKLLEELK